MENLNNIADVAREVRNKYYREYRKVNKDKIKAINKRWNEKNKDKLKEYQKKYWEKKAQEISRK